MSRGLDTRVRLLMRAVEPELRCYLGVTRLDSDFVGELYVRLREVLGSLPDDANQTDSCELVDELALALYLFISTHEAGAEAGPELLVSLKQALLPALSRQVVR